MPEALQMPLKAELQSFEDYKLARLGNVCWRLA